MFASAVFAEFFNDPFFRVSSSSALQSSQWTTFDNLPSARRRQTEDNWGVSVPAFDSVLPNEDRRLALWAPRKEVAVPTQPLKVNAIDAELREQPRKTAQWKPPPRTRQSSASASPLRSALESAPCEPLQCLPVLMGQRRRPPPRHTSRETEAWVASLRKPDIKRAPGAATAGRRKTSGSPERKADAESHSAGPPGTGKTLLVRALATECRGQFTFFNVSSSTLTSRWRGDSEKLVRLLFAEARSRAPSVIFIDEVDALCSSRGSATEHEASRRFKAELLVAMDGLLSDSGGGTKPPHVVLVAATNHPWDLDDAFLRRFERRVYVALPDEASRRRLAEVCLRGVSTAEGVDAAAEVAAGSRGYSGADVAAVCRAAAMGALRRLVSREGVDAVAQLPADRLQPPLTADDVRAALAAARPMGRAAPLRRYRAWAGKFATD